MRLALLFLALALSSAQAAENFPFGAELMLDAAPKPGSKRLPMLEIDDDGTASIDLWCASVHAQATVGDDTITIVPGEMQPAACDPDRQASDAALLATLASATKWRRNGDLIELSGVVTLRFRPMTN
jgi:heat shock protein HslJ